MVKMPGQNDTESCGELEYVYLSIIATLTLLILKGKPINQSAHVFSGT